MIWQRLFVHIDGKNLFHIDTRDGGQRAKSELLLKTIYLVCVQVQLRTVREKCWLYGSESLLIVYLFHALVSGYDSLFT